MSPQMLDTEAGDIVAYRYRMSPLLWNRILQVCRVSQNWDTSTGKNEGTPYEHWQDANEEEMQVVVNMLNTQLCKKKKKKQ